MARLTFQGQSKFHEKLQELEAVFAKDAAIEKAVYSGAKIVADKIRDNLEGVPEDNFKRLKPGEVFTGLSDAQKQDLENSFGLTPISRDKNGFVHTKAGFDGYGSFPTPSYPQGVPNALLARAAESGSSVRKKTPFIRPAVKGTREKAVQAMEDSIDETTKEVFEGG